MRDRDLRRAAVDRAGLASVAGLQTVVVDNGSRDDTVAFVRERFPEVEVVESGEPRSLRPAGIGGSPELETRSSLVLILNADAWLVARRARRLVAAASGIRGPASSSRASRTSTARCSGRCAASRPVWRLATEYLYLRKLAPRSTRLCNAFYGAGFDHDEERRGRVGDGRLHARPPRRDRRRRRLRRAVLPLQRGGRLVCGVPPTGAGVRVHAGRPLRARRRRVPRRPPLPRERDAASCATSPAPGARARPSGRAVLLAGDDGARPGAPGRERAQVRDVARWLGRATSDELLSETRAP